MTLGIDVVPIERLRNVLARSAGIEDRLFTPGELAYCDHHEDRVAHLAGTLAAKEAVIKACRLGSLTAFARRIEIIRDADGVPNATVVGSPHHRTSLSISHDGGVAVAVAISDLDGGSPADNTRAKTPRPRPGTNRAPVSTGGGRLRPNTRLLSYMKGDTGPTQAVDPRTLVEADHLTHGTDFP